MQQRELVFAAGLALTAIFAVYQTARVNQLTSQLTELETGADRAIGKASKAIRAGDFDSAIDTLHGALDRHPELKLKPEFQSLLNTAQEGHARVLNERRRAAELEEQKKKSKGLVIWKPQTKGLDAKFQSTDVLSLYSVLESLLPRAKDEFETSADFSKRLEDDLHKKKIGIFSVDDEFLFSTGTSAFLTYDAAKKGYKINLSESQSISSDTKNNGTFEGQNAFGVKKEIDRITLTSYDLQLLNHKAFLKCVKKSYGYCFDEEAGFIPFSPDLARQQEHDLRVVYVLKLKPPYVEHTLHTASATITSPTEFTYSTYKIYGELVRFLIVSHSTGEIIFSSSSK